MSKEKVGVVIHTRLRDKIMTPADRARLEKVAPVVWTDSADALKVEAACALLADCTVGLGSWGTPFPCAEIMAAAPKLRMWEHAAGTAKKMFGPHLKGRDFTIASCKTAIADCVAEMTIGEIILGLRRLFENAAANHRVVTGKVQKSPHARVMYGSTIGVVGASEVGKRVIKLLQPFGCEVLLYDPFVTEAQAAKMGAKLEKNLTELCRRSDAVTLHTPNVPATQKMIGAEQFKAMKDGAIFVNTARGSCIDEAALIAELQAGRLFALLDVTAPEPAAPESPLRQLPNAIVTSHIAGPQSFNIGAQAVNDIAAFLSGGKPLAVITEEILDHTA
jgi:phosphoglycerate dehydrogenase-like enzyme